MTESWRYLPRVLALGNRADLNLIDLARLCAHTPKMRYDRPAGRPRLVERVDGYVATYVRGEAVQKEGRETGARPGGLARGERTLQSPDSVYLIRRKERPHDG